MAEGTTAVVASIKELRQAVGSGGQAAPTPAVGETARVVKPARAWAQGPVAPVPARAALRARPTRVAEGNTGLTSRVAEVEKEAPAGPPGAAREVDRVGPETAT